jgi:hypothetical protein
MKVIVVYTHFVLHGAEVRMRTKGTGSGIDVIQHGNTR